MIKKEFIAERNIRLDIFLAEKLDETRNQIDHLIKKGFVTIENKKKAKSGLKLQFGQKVVVNFPKVIKQKALDVKFDVEIVYEDQYFMVLNKPSGVIVHGAPSVKEPTLVDWLKKQNISLSTISGEERYGIIHRLDKGTSGLIVVAKTNEAHIKLSSQLEDKTMGRYYLAFIDLPLKDDIIITGLLGRNQNNRLKRGVVPNGKSSKTAFIKLDLSKDERYELIAAKLFTGRTHQIRVHLESIQRHILGDSLYGFKGNVDKIKRVYLHAYSLYLKHPIDGKNMKFNIEMPDDMKDFYKNNFNGDKYSEKINNKFIDTKFNSSF
jgi:23S rRNA pseudouridine1911/1915/1917 synthase